MCYMGSLNRVGVRELRQNLSVHLARVVAGETLEVTDRGRAVAVLAPLTHDESIVSRLKRDGRMIPASGELLPGRAQRAGVSRWASRELRRERADRAL